MPSREMVRSEVNALVHETGSRLKAVTGGAALLWIVHGVNAVLGGALLHLGIAPRSLAGLLGILFAPFLHASWGHLVANTVPFLVLAFLTTSRRKLDLLVVTVVSALTSGLGAWLFGASGTVTVGASGVIFGYLGFLLARGFYERRVGPILLSLAVTLLFGGMLWGILPFLAAGVSWQAHLFGLAGGVLTARALGRERMKRLGRP